MVPYALIFRSDDYENLNRYAVCFVMLFKAQELHIFQKLSSPLSREKQIKTPVKESCIGNTFNFRLTPPPQFTVQFVFWAGDYIKRIKQDDFVVQDIIRLSDHKQLIIV